MSLNEAAGKLNSEGGGVSQAAEKLILYGKKCQGTASAVPQVPQNQ
jgi:hypothetical protein